MTNPQSLDWREIDGAIMDFQIHVRNVTGGNHYNAVDSTLLKEVINKSFLSHLSSLRDSIEGEIRGKKIEDLYLFEYNAGINEGLKLSLSIINKKFEEYEKT